MFQHMSALNINIEPPAVTLPEVLDYFYNFLDLTCGTETVGRCLAYLCRSRYGISYSEMLDLLSCDETVLQAHYNHEAPNVRRAPAMIWVNLKQYMKPIVTEVQVGGKIFYRILNSHVTHSVQERYRKYFAKISNSLMDYFDERWASGKKLPFPEPEEGIDIPKERFVLPQPIKYNQLYNRRKLDELSYQQGLLGRSASGLLDVENITAELETSGVHQVIQDFSQQAAISKDSDDLNMFISFLKTYKYHLQQNGRMFPYLFCRVAQANHITVDKISTKVKSLRNEATKLSPPALSFSKNVTIPVPDSPTITSHKVSKISRLKVEKNYVVSIETDNGKVSVWNIHTQEATRILTGVDKPRNIKMISNTKAVILCNRELKIYDLEKGKYLTKLKGVLNLKMPFYEIVDENRVIILSRNRMYLNIVNTESSDTEATFKAGEDRFMNSLLVSDNGEKCVCGDEVQKPFPLLVWDLPNRKLIHDMRLAGHEFVTSMSQITQNGCYVASVCRVSVGEKLKICL